MQQKGNRSVEIDFIKGTAIILVVFGHCIQYGSGLGFFEQGSYFDNILFKLIYSFHMPLFAMMSGYLFYKTVQGKDLVTILKRKFKSLLLPVVSWKTIEFIARGGIRLINGSFVGTEFLTGYVRSVLTAFWFLHAMFFSVLLVLFVEKILGKRWRYVYIILGMMMLFIPSDMPNIYLYIFLYPYFVAGFLVNDCTMMFQLTEKYKRLLFFILGIIFIALFVLYDYKSYIYISGISLVKDNAIVFAQLPIDLYRWFIGFIGSMLILIICHEIYNYWKDMRIINCITRIGQISLGIYILNTYTNIYVLPKLTEHAKPGLLIWILETFVELGGYFIFIVTVRKTSFGNKFLLGGR